MTPKELEYETGKGFLINEEDIEGTIFEEPYQEFTELCDVLADGIALFPSTSNPNETEMLLKLGTTVLNTESATNCRLHISQAMSSFEGKTVYTVSQVNTLH